MRHHCGGGARHLAQARRDLRHNRALGAGHAQSGALRSAAQRAAQLDHAGQSTRRRATHRARARAQVQGTLSGRQRHAAALDCGRSGRRCFFVVVIVVVYFHFFQFGTNLSIQFSSK